MMSAPLANFSTWSDVEELRGGVGVSLPACFRSPHCRRACPRGKRHGLRCASTDGADPHIAHGPDDLRLVLRLEGDRVDQFGGTACSALLDLRVTLANFARLDECIGDVCGELRAAYGDAYLRNGICAADGVDFWTCAAESPTELDEVRKTFGMIVVHMREKYRIELLWPYAKLRQLAALWCRGLY